jgi:hypothetical protein
MIYRKMKQDFFKDQPENPIKTHKDNQVKGLIFLEIKYEDMIFYFSYISL